MPWSDLSVIAVLRLPSSDGCSGCIALHRPSLCEKVARVMQLSETRVSSGMRGCDDESSAVDDSAGPVPAGCA